MIRYFRGYAVVLLTGAAPAQSLNRFSHAGIAFWQLEQPDAMHLRLRIYRRELPRARQAALRAMCTLEVERECGFAVRYGNLLRRPVLLLGLALALVLSLLAQDFVWVVRIEGGKALPQAAIRHALLEEGIGFGSWGPEISSPLLRMRMQLRLPQLQWLAANRDGGVLTVLVAEREPPRPEPEAVGPANVAAARAGIVTAVSALRGTAAVEPGDAVRTGELLISGITTWEHGSQLCRAEGEVYALTDRQMTVCIPQTYLEKRYTGRTEQELSVIFGRNRRKIFGNSRISHTSCDKIVSTDVYTLPSGDLLPLYVERVEYRYYELVPATLGESAAEALLAHFALADAREQMIAGTVLQSRFTLTTKEGCYWLTGDLNCEEMISRTVPIGLIGEDDSSGKADQRGTN